jgi:hypothetical protein
VKTTKVTKTRRSAKSPSTKSAQTTTTASTSKRGRKPKASRVLEARDTNVDTAISEARTAEGQYNDQSIVIEQQDNQRENQLAFQFGGGRTHQFTDPQSTFRPPPTSDIDFQPAASKANNKEAARARAAKAREARARKAQSKTSHSQGSNNNTSDSNASEVRKSARLIEAGERANRERESDLSSIDEVNMEDLERQLREGQTASSLPERQSDGDFPATQPTRKRKRPHSEVLSLNIRSAGKRKIHSRKASHAKPQ